MPSARPTQSASECGAQAQAFFHSYPGDFNLQPDWKTLLQSSDSGSGAILPTPTHGKHGAESDDILISHTWGWFMGTAQEAAKSPTTHKTTPSKQNFHGPKCASAAAEKLLL